LIPASDAGVEAVALGAQEVAAGEGLVRLSVTLPNGYKFNDLAPSSVAWDASGGDGLIAFDDGSNEQRIVRPEWPLELPVTFQSGEGEVGVDLTIYYCEVEKASLCLLHNVRLQVPLAVDDAGDSVLELDYTLPVTS